LRDASELLRDILEAIAAIERYQDRTRAELEADEMLQVWFLRHLQIIGEAARMLPPDVRNLAPDIPWSKIIGMRNVLVHSYFDVDTDIVWDAVQKEIAPLKASVERLLEKLDPDQA